MRGYMNGGLDSRFKILDAETGKELDGSHRFVLNFGYDKHAQKALLVYADSVRSENATLADDIEARLVRESNARGDANLDIHDLREWILGPPVEYRVAEALDSARRGRLEADCGTPTPIVTADGDIVAAVIRMFDPGVPEHFGREYHDPGEPGYDYWRFATVAEMREAGLLGDGS